MAVGQKAEKADADKVAWQDVEEETPQELFGRKCQFAFLIAVRVIPPAERDLVVFKPDQPAIGEGDAVRVASEVVQDMMRSAEGWFYIHDPAVAVQASHKGAE